MVMHFVNNNFIFGISRFFFFFLQFETSVYVNACIYECWCKCMDLCSFQTVGMQKKIITVCMVLQGNTLKNNWNCELGDSISKCQKRINETHKENES